MSSYLFLVFSGHSSETNLPKTYTLTDSDNVQIVQGVHGVLCGL